MDQERRRAGSPRARLSAGRPRRKPAPPACPRPPPHRGPHPLPLFLDVHRPGGAGSSSPGLVVHLCASHPHASDAGKLLEDRCSSYLRAKAAIARQLGKYTGGAPHRSRSFGGAPLPLPANSAPPRLPYMADLPELETRLRLLLEDVASPGYPASPKVQEFLAGQLRLALDSLQQNMAG